MTKNEIVALFRLIDGAYRTECKYDEESTKKQMQVWYEYLKDDDATIVRQALDYEITHSHYKPNIADIKERMRKMTTPAPVQMWNMLVESAKRGSKKKYEEKENGTVRVIYSYKEEFEKLPKSIRTWLGTPKELRKFHETNHTDFEKRQFLKDIKELQEAEETQLMIGETK